MRTECLPNKQSIFLKKLKQEQMFGLLHQQNDLKKRALDLWEYLKFSSGKINHFFVGMQKMMKKDLKPAL
jgi:hypothetical protein